MLKPKISKSALEKLVQFHQKDGKNALAFVIYSFPVKKKKKILMVDKNGYEYSYKYDDKDKPIKIKIINYWYRKYKLLCPNDIIRIICLFGAQIDCVDDFVKKLTSFENKEHYHEPKYGICKYGNYNVFVFYNPDIARIQSKMIYAASLDHIWSELRFKIKSKAFHFRLEYTGNACTRDAIVSKLKRQNRV